MGKIKKKYVEKMDGAMENSLYIQRLKNPTEYIDPYSFGGGLANGGVDKKTMEQMSKIFSFDYMGAAEFEFGKILTKKIMKTTKTKALYNRYKVEKTSGKPTDPKAKYFVLRYDKHGSDKVHIAACQLALRVYAEAIQGHLPVLSVDLKEELKREKVNV